MLALLSTLLLSVVSYSALAPIYYPIYSNQNDSRTRIIQSLKNRIQGDVANALDLEFADDDNPEYTSEITKVPILTSSTHNITFISTSQTIPLENSYGPEQPVLSFIPNDEQIAPQESLDSSFDSVGIIEKGNLQNPKQNVQTTVVITPAGVPTVASPPNTSNGSPIIIPTSTPTAASSTKQTTTTTKSPVSTSVKITTPTVSTTKPLQTVISLLTPSKNTTVTPTKATSKPSVATVSTSVSSNTKNTHSSQANSSKNQTQPALVVAPALPSSSSSASKGSSSIYEKSLNNQIQLAAPVISSGTGTQQVYQKSLISGSGTSLSFESDEPELRMVR